MVDKIKKNTFLNVILLFLIVIAFFMDISFVIKMFKSFESSSFVGFVLSSTFIWLMFYIEYRIFVKYNGKGRREVKEINIRSGFGRLIPIILLISIVLAGSLLTAYENYNLDSFLGCIFSAIIFVILDRIFGREEKEFEISTRRTLYKINIGHTFMTLTFITWAKITVILGILALLYGYVLQSGYINF